MLSSLRNFSASKKTAVTATTAVILVGFLYLFYLTEQMAPPLLPGYPGDAFFPQLVLGFSVLFAVIILLMAAFGKKGASLVSADSVSQIDIFETLYIAVITGAYMLLMEQVGFEIMTVIYMFVLLFPRILMPRPKAIVVAAISAVVTTVFIYFAFVIILKVAVPLKFLPAYINF